MCAGRKIFVPNLPHANAWGYQNVAPTELNSLRRLSANACFFYCAQLGSAGSKLSQGIIIKYRMTVSNTKLIRFNQTPHLTISETVTRSLPKITVLGPVPAGIINPRDEATVAGIISNKGFMLAATAMLANTGNKILAVAVLELNSVNSITKAMTNINTTMKG